MAVSTQPLISVIVPVYNVERYLDQCVESLIGQTYERLEIILVDDGSTDSSGEQCNAWANRDNRIRAVRQCNAGLAAALGSETADENASADGRTNAGPDDRPMEDIEQDAFDFNTDDNRFDEEEH